MILRLSPFLSLATLRRSTRLATFALMVFVLRLGIVAACEPNDLAELFSGHAEQHLVVSTLDTSSESAPDALDPNLPGHCLHCGCHFPATLPIALQAVTITQPHFLLPGASLGPIDAPPGRHLRPPIS